MVKFLMDLIFRQVSKIVLHEIFENLVLFYMKYLRIFYFRNLISDILQGEQGRESLRELLAKISGDRSVSVLVFVIIVLLF